MLMITQIAFLPSLVSIGPVVCKKKIEIWKAKRGRWWIKSDDNISLGSLTENNTFFIMKTLYEVHKIIYKAEVKQLMSLHEI